MKSISEKIFLSTPNLSGNEEKYLKECIQTNFVSTAGPFVSRFENEMSQFLDAKYAVSTVNGTAALHLSLILAGVGNGDEVLVPNLTFVAPLNAVSYTGASPILIDSDWETLGLCPDTVNSFLQENVEIQNKKAMNKKTGKHIKVMIVMHTLGISAHLNELLDICQKYHLIMIEDASESLGAKYKGKYTGTFGTMGTLSFNGNKILTTGGGGMILTNDEKIAKRAKHLSTTAKTDGLNFFHDEVAYNYRMVNILAALGVAQLEQLSGFLETKKKNALIYAQNLNSIPGLSFYRPKFPEFSNDWFYSLLVENSFPYSRDQLIDKLLAENIEVRPIWTLMEDLPMYKNCQKSKTNISREIHERTINLPCSTHLKENEILKICHKLREWGKVQ